MGAHLSFLYLAIVEKKERDIHRLTDNTVLQWMGPKRTSRIQELFHLAKEEDVHQSVIRKPLNKEGKKPRTKVPKIQSYVTLCILQYKHQCMALNALRKPRRLQNMLKF